MKILCKKDYRSWISKEEEKDGKEGKLMWSKDKLYEMKETTYISVLESNFTPHTFVKDYKYSSFYRDLNEYFYLPEETKNILRNELIERMLE